MKSKKVVKTKKVTKKTAKRRSASAKPAVKRLA
jgi:hypothetical protein